MVARHGLCYPTLSVSVTKMFQLMNFRCVATALPSTQPSLLEDLDLAKLKVSNKIYHYFLLLSMFFILCAALPKLQGALCALQEVTVSEVIRLPPHPTNKSVAYISVNFVKNVLIVSVY